MLKNIALITFLFSGFAFAQKSELQQNDVVGNPTFIEESMQKARIRIKQIEGYELEYYTKSTYSKEGNPSKRDYFNEAGELTFTESFTYSNEGKIIAREMKSENDVNIFKTDYKLDDKQNIIYEKEVSLLEDTEIFTEKKYNYQNGFLSKVDVKYNQGSYRLEYKNDANGNPQEELYYDKDNKLINKYLRKFDTNNNIVEETTYDETGKVRNVSTIKYQYDNKKNWTKRTQYVKDFDQPISNTTRTVRY